MNKNNLKYPLIVFLILLIISCTNHKEKTFLDFEFGMTYKEYIDHAYNLKKSGFIKNLNGTNFDYSIKLGNNDYAFFEGTCYVYSNSRLSMIQLESKYDLNDEQKDALYQLFVSKHGQTEYPYRKAKNNIYRAVWRERNESFRLVFIDTDENGKWKTKILYQPSSKLNDKIDELNKKENGIIDVENEY